MGRPSVASERRRQITDATLVCLASHGYAGTTLERIAEEASMSRGHVRHFAGNRDDILVEAARSFFGAPDDRSPDVSPALDSLEATLDYLFGPFGTPTSDNAVTLAFVEAARQIPALREIVLAAYTRLERVVVEHLTRRSPAFDPIELEDVGYGVVSIAIGNTFLSDVASSDARARAARAAADTLVRRALSTEGSTSTPGARRGVHPGT